MMARMIRVESVRQILVGGSWVSVKPGTAVLLDTVDLFDKEHGSMQSVNKVLDFECAADGRRIAASLEDVSAISYEESRA